MEKELLDSKSKKELLLKDLSARVPYGVKVEAKVPVNRTDYKEFIDKVTSVSYNIDIVQVGNTDVIVGYEPHFDIKPFLFPLSSMTEEQRKEFDATLKYLPADEVDIWTLDTYDWCNKNHFDHRGLIPMGLARDATGLNIY